MHGADTVEGGAGADEMDGDNGNERRTQVRSMQIYADVLSYAGSDAGVTVNLATASASGGHATGDTIVTYEVEIAPAMRTAMTRPSLMSLPSNT